MSLTCRFLYDLFFSFETLTPVLRIFFEQQSSINITIFKPIYFHISLIRMVLHVKSKAKSSMQDNSFFLTFNKRNRYVLSVCNELPNDIRHVRITIYFFFRFTLKLIA